MKLGTQYYRPPFPVQSHWADDLRRMKDAGLNTVQLWVLWAWVEPAPGDFRFEAYDRLVELAAAEGLDVVLSTIAEIQPMWIHREVPGSELVTLYGHPVASCARNECHFGLTPGGCSDHPEVWSRMRRFLETVVERYRKAPNLYGWDAWNELRWDVNADDRVCFCPHTIAAYRQWLERRFGGLDALNAAWLRRYGQWEDVHPGKMTGIPFTDNMAFAHFTTWRACEHAQRRYDVMKALDPEHPITVHGGAPSAYYEADARTSPLNRGNDWFYADRLDGVGTSSFPKWSGIDDADFGARVEFVASAARGKRVWLSELQGGRSASGFDIHASVDAASQQRWIWNGIACGADTILFWCWRDEVFCREAAGFGLTGKDGLAAERLDAMRVTGHVLAENAALIDAYRPTPGRVGVLFSPQSYYLQWASTGSGGVCRQALGGYARALVKRSIPYRVIEEEHLDELAQIDVLYLPRVLVTGPELERRLEDFVRGGGTLVCESETGAYTPEGFYREESARFTARMAGIEEIGRRRLPRNSITAVIDGDELILDAAQWLCPWQRGAGNVLSDCDEGAALVEVPVGKGLLMLCGSYFGQVYSARQSGREPCEGHGHTQDFERFVEIVARRAGWRPVVEVLAPAPSSNSFLYVKTGSSGGRAMVFVFFQTGQGEARLRFAPEFCDANSMTDIMDGSRHPMQRRGDDLELTVSNPARGFRVLVEALLPE